MDLKTIAAQKERNVLELMLLESSVEIKHNVENFNQGVTDKIQEWISASHDRAIVVVKEELDKVKKSLVPTTTSPSPRNLINNIKRVFSKSEEKAYTSGTLGYDAFNGYGNQGVPVLPYIYSGGSLYNPFLNITTVAALYSMYAQVAPVKDAVDSLRDAAARVPLLLKQRVLESKDGQLIPSIINYDPTLQEQKTGKFKEGGSLTLQKYLLNIWNVINMPNGILQFTKDDLIKASVYELGTTGNLFIVKEYAQGVTRRDLKECRNVFVTGLRVGKTFEFTQYDYATMGFYIIPKWQETKYAYNSGMMIKYDDIFMDDLGNVRQIGTYNNQLYEIYQVNLGIGNTQVGQSPLLSCIQFIQIHYLASLYTRSYFQNMACPSGIVQVAPREGRGTVSDTQRQQIADYIRENLKGATNAGKTITWTQTDFELTYTPIATTIKDTNVEAQMRWAEEEIYKVFNMPPSLKERRGDKYNTLSDELRFYKEGVFPMTDLLCNTFQRMFINTNLEAKKAGYFFDMDETELPEFKAMRVEEVTKLMPGIPLMKINEARQKLELPDAGPEADFIPISDNMRGVEGGSLLQSDDEYESSEKI